MIIRMNISKRFTPRLLSRLTRHGVGRIGILAVLVTLCAASIQPAAAQSHPVISVDNASQLAQVNMFGRGPLSALDWLPDGKTLLAETGIGVWVYASDHPAAAPRLIPRLGSGVQVSKDGRWIIGLQHDSQDDKYKAVVIDVATGALLATFPAATYRTWSLLLNADSSTLAIVDGGRYDTDTFTVALYTMPSGTPITTFTVKNINSFSFAPDGTIVMSGPGGLQLFDGKTGKLQDVIGGSNAPNNVNVSPDKTTFIGYANGGVAIWNRRGSVSWIGIGDGTFDISPDFSLVAVPSAQFANDILVRNVKTRAYHFLMGHTDAVTQVVFSPDGKSLLSVSKDNTVRVWDVATSKTRLVIPTGNDAVQAAYYRPDGQAFATQDRAGQIKIWDVTKGTLQTTWAGHYERLEGMALSPDGKTIAAQVERSTPEIDLWDAITGAQQGALQSSSGFGGGIAYSPDGNLIAGGSINKNVGIWDAHTGAQRDLIGTGVNVAFSPDSKTLVTTIESHVSGQSYYAQKIQMWDIASSTLSKELLGSPGEIQSLAFSPDGSTLAVGDGSPPQGCNPDVAVTPNDATDPIIRLWNIADGTVRAELRAHQRSVFDLAYSADGKLLASADCDDTIRVWDTVSFKQVRTISVPGFMQGVSVAFSPDGTLLAAGGKDSVRVWEVATGKLLALRTDPADVVFRVTFSPDGRALYAGSGDGTIRTYAINGDGTF